MKKRTLISKSINFIFVFLVLFGLTNIFAYGHNLNTVKHTSTLLTLKKYESSNPYIHVSGKTKEGEFSIDNMNDFCKKTRRLNSENKVLYAVGDDNSASYLNFTTTVHICSVPAYSDYSAMEWNGIPLYRGIDYSIRKGAKFGANYASYIPSSMASQLCKNFNLESFDDVIDYGFVLTSRVGGYKYTFSVNNIYFDGNTEHWTLEDDRDGSFGIVFGEWNKNSIFSHCPKVFSNTNNIEIHTYFKNAYANLDYFTKQVLNMSGSEIEFDFYNKEQTTQLSLSSLQLKDNYFGNDQILPISLFFVSILGIILMVVFAPSCRKRMFKNMIATILLLCFIGLIIEILKTVFATNLSIFIVFNFIGTSWGLIYILILLFIGAIFYKGEKYEKC